MMAALAEAFVAVRADTSKVKGDVEKGVNQAKIDESGDKAGSRFGKTFSAGFGKTLAAGVGALVGAGLVTFGKDAIAKASDLNETVNKSNVIFGKNAATIDNWSKTASKSLGLSRQQALDTASGFGDMFSQLGIGGTQATKMSQQVVQLSADLGSFNNLPTAEVAESLSAAFRGEFDSLQRVIPNINAARVEHEALAATGKKSASELTAQEKATATLAIVQKDGARAAGDFARTSGGLANQSKILKAQFSDMQAEVGAKLVPALTKALSVGLKVMDWIKKNSDVMKPLLIGLGVLIPAVYALNLALSLNPISLVVIGLAALGAGLFLAWKKSETFRDIVTGVFKVISAVISVWWNYYIKPIFKALVEVFKFAWERAKDFGRFVAAAFETVKEAGKKIVQWFKDLPGNILRAIGSVVGTLVQKGKDIVTGLLTGLKWIWDHSVYGWIFNRRKVILDAIGDALSWLKQKGRDVLTGFLSGLKAVWEDIKKWVGGIATWIKDHKGPVSLDRNLLVPAGRAIMQGFFNGLKSGAGAAWDFVASVGGKTVDQLRAAVGFVAGGFTGGSGSNIDIGRAMAAQVGWVGDQWKALFSLWTRESGWNNLADNPTSTAFGIPQFINSTAAAYGVLGDTDPRHQIDAGIRYIRDAYGTPLNAWQKWLSRSPHWYEQGAWDIPSLQLGVLHPHEMVVPAKPAEEFRRGAGGGVVVQFSNCTFAGTSKAQFTDLVVEAFDRAKSKRRL